MKTFVSARAWRTDWFSVTSLDGQLDAEETEGCLTCTGVDEADTVRDAGAAYILPLSRPHGLIRPHLHRPSNPAARRLARGWLSTRCTHVNTAAAGLRYANEQE